MKNGFSNWGLKVWGLAEKPLEISLMDLYALKKEIQITKHYCIQGRTAIREWGGVAMNYILLKYKPLPKAKYEVFTFINILLASNFMRQFH
jgi:methionine sulfoxide reductase catalytic subunit